MDQHILTMDIGTTSIKVSLFSKALEPVCTVAEEYELETFPGNVVELNPLVYQEKIEAAIKELHKQMKPTDEIIAIGITTQGETLIPVDIEGKPLCPAIIWLDSRADKQAEFISQHISEDEFYNKTGLPQLNGSLPLAKLLYIKEEMPEIYNGAYKFLLVEDYIIHWLTGRFVSEKSLQCSTGYFDLLGDGYWEEVLNLIGIDLQKLPELLSCGQCVGSILPERANTLQLSTDVEVVTGAMDQTAAALAAGCTMPGRVTETTGTALVMAAYTKRPDFSHTSKVTIYRHALDDCYIYLPIGITGGMALKWFKDNFCDELAEHGQKAYNIMDQMALDIPPGCNGLITLPHFAGCINPVALPNATAVFYGATLDTSKADFIRSIMEAIGFMLRDFIEMLKGLGCDVKEVYSLGGGSRSELWQQIKADICQKEFITVGWSEMSSAGAAILAAWGTGIIEKGQYPVFTNKRKFVPRSENIEVYNRAYSKYKLISDSINKLYKEVV